MKLIYEGNKSLIYLREQGDLSPVVIKTLKEEFLTPPQVTRLYNEYEILKSLNIKGVLRAHDKDALAGKPSFAMNYFNGSKITSIAPLTIETLIDFLDIAIGVSHTLGKIHEQYVIHKDITPANILVNPVTKETCIIDFGISSRINYNQQYIGNPDQLEGTLAYVSPEQTGRMNRVVDYRTDLYSLGVTFYETLTGRLPFEAKNSLELVHCHIAQIAEPPHLLNPEIPAVLSEIVMKLMQKNAENRYQSAYILETDLQKCRTQWVTTGKVEAFDIAPQNFSRLFQIPEKLYGRAHEEQLLIEAVERIGSGATELMLVTGYSGVGKSALINQVHKLLIENQGYFINGKYDQFQRNIPYYAIHQALKSFIRQLLTESAQELDQWRKNILAAIGTNGQVLIDVLPSLELIIGQQPPLSALGAAESQHRFQMVFQQFLRVISRQEHPLVMFIDDLHWADLASLNLLKVLMEDVENQYLLVIGAYRDNEVYEQHPLFMALEDIAQTDAVVSRITLQNLSKKDVRQLISDTLHSTPEATESLTELVYSKTLGNAFFVRQFLTSLYEEKLLWFNAEDAEEVWGWDIAQIEAKNITDNVVDLMAGKIQRLLPETRHILRLAASIGDRFSLHTLSLIYKKLPTQTLQDLWSAIAEGLILPLDNHYNLLLNGELDSEDAQKINCQFRFLHDRVQQAAYSLIEDEEKKRIHYEIGQLLLKNLAEEALEEHIFDVVGHLNLSTDVLPDGNEKIALAKLNLFAAQKAKEATAYQTAVDYLAVALELLPQNAWQNVYRLTCDIHLEKAECEYLNTNFDATFALHTHIVENTNEPLDLAKIYETMILLYTNLGNMTEAVMYCRQVVGILDEPIPDSPAKLLVKVQQKLRFIQEFLQDKNIEDLGSLPAMEDQEKLALMNILVKSVLPAYQTDQRLVALVITTMVETSFRYGNTPFSAYGYAMFAILQGAMLHDYPASFRFGQTAMELANQPNAVTMKGAVHFVFGNFVSHWGQPLEHSLEVFKEGFRRSLEGGDHIHTGYSASRYLMYSLLHGHPLDQVHNEANNYTDFLRKKADYTCREMSIAIRQMVRCMQGKTPETASFDSKGFEEAAFIKAFEANLFSLSHFYLLKIMTYYLLGKPQKAQELLPIADEVMPGSTGSYVEPVYNFYHSMTTLAMLAQTDQSQKEIVLARVKINQQQMKVWADNCPENYQHLYLLVAAEQIRVTSNGFDALDFYLEAIERAKEQKFTHLEALANELLAVFWYDKNKLRYAKSHLKQAYRGYKKWGGRAKLAWLRARYGDEVLPKEALRSRGNLRGKAATSNHDTRQATKDTASALDLASIMKASQTLAEEVRINHLISKMLQIVIENAGAQKGVLVNVENDQLKVVGEGDSKEIKMLETPEPLEESLKVPQSIINYISRTQKYLVLDDASQIEEFSRDEYIQQHHPKSVLCFSVSRKETLICVFYLENNLTNQAFSDDRIRLLKMLSTQMAISMENALLYDNLEQKVVERTNDLNNALTDVKVTNMKIMDSIRYAKHIQTAILPSGKDLGECFQDHFVLFVPKDVVSGDFYWLSKVDGYTFIVVLDCTGHGVPGAFMSMVGNTLLNEIINEKRIFEPSDIMNALHLGVEKALRQRETDNSDGMDLCLCRLEPQDTSTVLTFSGAKRPLFYVTNGQFGEIKGDRKSIAGWRGGDVKHFTQHQLVLKENDLLYLSTDGYADTPNPRRRSFGKRRLIQLLESIHPETMENQQRLLEQNLETHQDGVEQRDDITIMGLKM
ncbi:AAA family ATPase [uncultured Microscilla sp.]|uniref:AAA family ATPase n=1 Tax=uncultured Microscilla sp. TaxID=432653 RepID=UPI00262B6D84|nr:AAA family ATPase [uncultured Microscilla sp.]